MNTTLEAKQLSENLIKFCKDNKIFYEYEEKNKPKLTDILIKIHIKVKE